jgi:hypothetical protein
MPVYGYGYTYNGPYPTAPGIYPPSPGYALSASPFGAGQFAVELTDEERQAAESRRAAEQEQAAEFRKAVDVLQKAQSVEEKAAAREQLGKIVGAQLEHDLQEREAKLAHIEARAKELREQLEQRRASKAEMQKMLLMLIESPETGLGLPPAWLGTVLRQPTLNPQYGLPMADPRTPTVGPAIRASRSAR